MSGFIWENLWHLVHLLLNFCKCLDASMSFGGVLIPAVNSIGSGLRLCTVGVVNIISLGLIGFFVFSSENFEAYQDLFNKISGQTQGGSCELNLNY